MKAALSGKAFPGFIDSLVDNLDVAVMRAQSRQTAGKFQGIQRALKHGRRYEQTPDPELVDLVIKVTVGKMIKIAFSMSSEILTQTPSFIKENIIYQMERVGRSPIVSAAMESGSLLLVPCIYKLHTGEVEIMKFDDQDDILTIS